MSNSVDKVSSLLIVFGVNFIYNNYLCSRVRIEVLRAISLKITRPDNTAYCVSNVPRPYLSVGPPRGGRRASYKYVEAIETFGEVLSHADLSRAYERAGNRFIGKSFSLPCCRFRSKRSCFLC